MHLPNIWRDNTHELSLISLDIDGSKFLSPDTGGASAPISASPTDAMKYIANQPKQERAQVEQGGDNGRVATQRAKGEFVRERIDALFDTGRRGCIDDIIFPQNARKRFCYRSAMLRDNRLENLGSVPSRGGE